jgi:hypothetical protein
MKIPLGASGSSQIIAKDLVPEGRLNQVSGGEKFKPLQVNLAGMGSPSEKVDEVMLMFAI